MSEFRTIVDIPSFEWKVDYKSKIMLLGSCFAENTGVKLKRLKFNVDMNPFGIVYNPVSVKNSLDILLGQQTFSGDDLFEHNGQWNSWLHHSRFSSVDKNEAINTINKQIAESANFLKEADSLFITFGTAWVYELKKTGLVVSNCHKVPASEFRRFRLTPDEIVNDYTRLLEQLREINPRLKVVFTVSPIRHWKDGAVENQLSKATLLLSIDRLVQHFGKDKMAYFPAYELVMDDLRDYRYYDEDMLHPNNVAVKYIWQKFCKSLMAEKEYVIIDNIEKIIRAVAHRPMNKQTPEYHKFLKQQLKLVEELMITYNWLNLKEEKNYFSQAISQFD